MHPLTTGLLAVSFVVFGFAVNSALECSIGGSSCPDNTLSRALSVLALLAPVVTLAYAIIEAAGEGSLPRTRNLGVIFVLLSLLYTVFFWPAVVLVVFPIAAYLMVRSAEDQI
jgi:hypothetical protein